MNISIFQSDNNNDASTFNTKENKGSVNFDTCGNTYIEYNSKVYQICISKKNDIYLDYADYNILSTESPEYGHIIESSSESNGPNPRNGHHHCRLQCPDALSLWKNCGA